MLVSCPKCKSRLKIADEKIAPEGSRFKCPKCSAVLLIKRPKAPAPQKKPLDRKKVIVAHAEPDIVERAKKVLEGAGYLVITSLDGVDMMVKTLRELPGTAVVDVALPKVFGFEICKRLRERPETKEMRLILISSIYDKTRYKREPVSLYGADDYIDEHEIEEKLVLKVKGEAPKPPQVEEPPKPKVTPPPPPPPPKPEAKPQPKEADIDVQKARRLIRAILSDLYLYSAQKVEESIKSGKFREAFSVELNEGLKLYNQRVSDETKRKGDFFNEEIDKFIETRKKSLGLT